MKNRTVKPIIGFRPGALVPIIDRWLILNPGMTPTVLVRRGLRRELLPLARKEFPHLIEKL